MIETGPKLSYNERLFDQWVIITSLDYSLFDKESVMGRELVSIEKNVDLLLIWIERK